jgi:Tsi6
VESSDPVPVQSDLPRLLDQGLRMVRERLEASPHFPVYLSIQRQLEYLQQTLTLGQSPAAGKVDSLTLGVYAAREFENSDPDFADVLFNVNYLANRMPLEPDSPVLGYPVPGFPVPGDGVLPLSGSRRAG